MHLLGIFFALGAGIFFGILAPTTKIAYNLGVGVGIAIILRYFIASLLIAPFIPFQKNLLGVYKKFFLDFVLITFGSILLTSGLLLSVKFIDVSLAIIIFCTYPIFVLIFSIIIDKEIIPNIIKFLFLSTFIGLFFALGPAVSSLNAFGFLCAITASIGATTMIVANQRMSNKSISPIQINIFINFFNAIFFFCLLSLFFSLDFSISKVDFFVILIPSFSYAIALLLQLLAIPRIGQSLTALFLYLEPVVAIIGSVILLKENLNNYQIFGSILVLSSLGFATYFTDKSKNDSS
tara:strand:+ start:2200 stop:3078 length:879 start_codon:yes stop_codon:yes gene_type:complete